MSAFTETLIVDLDGGAGVYTSIAAAIADLPTSGGTIIVEAGTYTIASSSDTVKVPSNVTIIGRGGVTINVTAEVYAFTNSNFAKTDGTNTNIVISGFKINVTIAENSYDYPVITMRNVSNSVFEKLYITATNPQISGAAENSTAINFVSTYTGTDYQYSDCVCKNNIVRQCILKNYSIGICSYTITSSIPTTSAMCAIQNNHISYCSAAILMNNAFFLRISGNVLTNSLYLNMSVERSKFFVIRGNQINETYPSAGSHGVYPSGCEGMIITGNVFYRNSLHGIKPRFASSSEIDQYYVIVGNICLENGRRHDSMPDQKGTGIFLEGYCRCQVILGNNCVNNTANGIRVQHDDTSPAVYNLVIGNVAVCHSVPGSDAAISVVDTTNNLYPAGRNVTYTLP